MTMRTRETTLVFSHPFRLGGVDRILPPGAYRVVSDDELIEGLSFPVYRRIATMIELPSNTGYASSIEMMPVDPRELQAAQEVDRATDPASATDVKLPSGRN